MELQIGRIIRERRKHLNLTQENLAIAVGVSVPAVSKWESGSSYPDITLLLPIACTLNLTVDELLDNPGSLSVEEVPKLGEKAKRYFEQGDYLNGISFCQKEITENPYCLLLQYHFAAILINYLSVLDGSEYTLALQTAIAWLENATQIQEPVEIKLASYYYLGQMYLNTEEYEKAEEALKKLPNDIGLDFASSIALLFIQKKEYDKAEQFCQEKLYIDVNYACSNLAFLADGAYKTGDYEKSYDLSSKEVELLDLFKINSDKTIYALWQMALCANLLADEVRTSQCLNQMMNRIDALSDSPITGNALFEKVKAPTQVVSAEMSKYIVKDNLKAMIINNELMNVQAFSQIQKRL